MAATTKPARPITLPDVGAKVTKKAMQAMALFNAAVERLLLEHGARCIYASGEVSELLGYEPKRFELDTEGGVIEVSPGGHSVFTRFREPERAARWLPCRVLTNAMNRHSGKWNRHYFGMGYFEAIQDVTWWLDRITGTDEERWARDRAESSTP